METEDYRLQLIIPPEKLERHLDQIARKINEDYTGKSVVAIGILKGAFIFLADLVRRLSMPVEIDFVRLASYGTETETSGHIRITKDIETPLRGRDVLVVEDIVDTGLTLAYLRERLLSHDPNSLKICTLIDKYERRQVDVPLDYVCIPLQKGFVVGYGLDFSERHRNLPGIYEVEFLGK